MQTQTKPVQSSLQARRHKRLAREIALLEAMDASLWRKTWFCAVLYFMAQMAIWAALVDVVYGDQLNLVALLAISFFGALFTAFLVQGMGYGLGIFFTILVAILAIAIFEGDTGVDLPFESVGGESNEDSKSKIKRRIARAIGIRKAQLQQRLDRLT